jgi:hypothetical protein
VFSKTNPKEAEMGSEARLLQTKSGDWYLHDPGIGLLVRIVPMEMAQEALRSQSGERNPIYALYRAGAYHAAYRETVRDLRRAAVALLKRIKKKTGRVFSPRDVLINKGSSQEPGAVSLQDFVDLQASPLAAHLLDAQFYTNCGKVKRDFSDDEMREFHGLLRKIQVAICSAGDAGEQAREQARVWLDRGAPRRSLLDVYPFFDLAHGLAWKYAQKVVPSIAENLDILMASGFFAAMGDWLKDMPDAPLGENQALKRFGVGFWYPENASSRTWSGIVVYYHDYQLASLDFWPALGQDESPDDLRRYGLSRMVPLR